MTNISALYIHIPFCISKCKYCDFFSIPCGHCVKNPIVPDSYIESLCNEISYRLDFYHVTKLETIYIGGGTPSLLTKDQLLKIFHTIKKSLPDFSPELCEITIESNPDDITVQLLKDWESIGINRISLGIQSFDDGALSYVGRRASAKVNYKALETIRGQWKGELSVDLICGLPNQGAESFYNDLDMIFRFSPDHISMYSLTIEDETPLGKEYNNGILKYDFDFADELWLNSKEILKNHGYNHYEVSNFCLPGKECIHNLKYWNHESYLGVGSGGTGTVYYDDGSGLRWTNIRNIPKYTEYWNNRNEKSLNPENEGIVITEDISLDVSRFEFFMMGMRKLQGISTSQYKNVFGTEIPEKYINVIKKWEVQGLCSEKKGPDNDIFYGLGCKGIIYLNKFLEEIL